MPDLTLFQMYLIFVISFMCGVVVGVVGHIVYRDNKTLVVTDGEVR